MSKITLTSSDGENFEVDEAVARMSQTLKFMIEDNCATSPIPIPNVDGKMLSRVLDYCNKHVVEAGKEKMWVCRNNGEEITAWDAEYIKIDLDTLYDLIMAANYLNISGLLHLACQGVANKLTGKSAEEMRAILNIENDFTAEEVEAIKKENTWYREPIPQPEEDLSSEE